MYTGKIYGIRAMLRWTRYETILFVLIISAWVSIYYFFDLVSFKIPWTPIGLMGTAVAFVIGFQNNAVYDRIWESRKIWGGIVNTSRTFGVYVRDMVTNNYSIDKVSEDILKNEVKIITYRHIAWLTALRYAMRQKKEWETTSDHKTNREWGIEPPEWNAALEDDLKPYLSESEFKDVMSKDNHQTALLYSQSYHIKELKDKGIIWEFSFLELEGLIKEMFSFQGKTERIKNFPYPRQYASLNYYFMWLLLLFLPMALAPQFYEVGITITKNYPMIGGLFIWASIPVYTAIAWMFHTMERIGRTGENPFEGNSNDVPISTIARGIEIDLRQNLGENKETIPKQFNDDNGIHW